MATLKLNDEELGQLFKIMLRSNQTIESIYSQKMGELSSDFHKQRGLLRSQVFRITQRLKELAHAAREVLDNHATPHKQREGARRTTEVLRHVVPDTEKFLSEPMEKENQE